MDEIWEKAMETALEGQTDPSSIRSLPMDGVVKCVHGRLPPPSVFERFRNLRHLSIANIGVSSLERLTRLRNLQKLILSDNRISGGLDLAKLKLVSLDLYECPVTRVKDYRSSVLGLIESLKSSIKLMRKGMRGLSLMRRRMMRSQTRRMTTIPGEWKLIVRMDLLPKSK
ncbi:hypothetical protein DM860_014864 [Cuscuta australis]|uniref:U2A'/phosphoprotein 32 family A C-terminal domain-containing protein n=1 Tax=Cuscuta australis TaxID=267555 RepID=A0A328DI57_9ASTE|nr:hypothetical protein DM860_014864 [Cuscuta australis]